MEETIIPKESRIKKRPEAPPYNDSLPTSIASAKPLKTILGNNNINIGDNSAKSSVKPRKGVEETDGIFPYKEVRIPPDLPSEMSMANHSFPFTNGSTDLPINNSSFRTSFKNITSILDQNDTELTLAGTPPSIALSADSTEDSSEENSDIDYREDSPNAAHGNGTQVIKQNDSLKTVTTNSPNFINNTNLITKDNMNETIFRNATLDDTQNTTLGTINSTATAPSIFPSIATAEPREFGAISTPLGKPATASMNDDTPQRSSNTAVVVSVFIVIIVCALVGFVGYKRFSAYWNRRHYSRVDFLVDGLYEM